MYYWTSVCVQGPQFIGPYGGLYMQMSLKLLEMLLHNSYTKAQLTYFDIFCNLLPSGISKINAETHACT